jgi:hypothetical protein
VPARASQIGQVLTGGEAAVDHRHHPAEPPAAQVVFHLLEHGLVVGVARPAPHPHRDPLAGDGQADHDLRQVGPVVLGVPKAANAILAVAFEEGRGGVEAQQVDLEVEQVGGGEAHRLLHPRLSIGLHQQVHRPIRLIVVHPGKPGDRRVLGGPLRRRQLAHRVDRAVGHQREQHPLHIGGEPAHAEHAAEGIGDTEPLPQPVQQPHRAQRTSGLHRRGLVLPASEVGASAPVPSR